MASVGFLALMDDIATLLDDVSVMTKVAAKKTAGVLGDDLALNAQQVTGVRANRELPVVWAVAKGSLINKLVLVPLALVISAYSPMMVAVLLMLGGLYLSYEGVEKVVHFFHKAEKQAHQQALTAAVNNPEVDIKAFEKQKIKGAIRTDFILSAEIIVIALGAAQGADLLTQTMVVSLIAVTMTIGVYGLVAAIVKFDYAGLALMQHADDSAWGRFQYGLGSAVLSMAPRFMRLLSAVGLMAMFLVGGGILVHGLPFLHHWLEPVTVNMAGGLALLVSMLFNALVGFIAGAIVLLAISLSHRVTGKKNDHE